MEGNKRRFSFGCSVSSTTLAEYLRDQAETRRADRSPSSPLFRPISTAAKYDDDGIDVHFLNSKRVGSGLKVRRIISPVSKATISTLLVLLGR